MDAMTMTALARERQTRLAEEAARWRAGRAARNRRKDRKANGAEQRAGPGGASPKK